MYVWLFGLGYYWSIGFGIVKSFGPGRDFVLKGWIHSTHADLRIIDMHFMLLPRCFGATFGH